MTYRKPVVKKCYNCGTHTGLKIVKNKISCELCTREFQMPQDENWVAAAACRKSDIDFFSDEKLDIKMAKLICNDCPVKNICLAEAMKRKERYGVWGGTSEDDRNALLNRKRNNWRYH